MASNSKSEVQASKADFRLYTLGWEAFQNLCGHIVRQILGQTVTVFSSNNDAGQDGAFQGEWKRKNNEIYSGRFVFQCKFTSKNHANLSLSNLSEEIEKAKHLAKDGIAQTYLLITNYKISGTSDKAIRKAFSQINGLLYFDILGEEWITQSIIDSKHLRAFVPRVYGLGDLSQILDERAYAQAVEILETWNDNLAKFVPTEAHELSVRALLKNGFVLLLGDPMAGKSTIAAALALAAADTWNCTPIFIHHPDDIRTHWNPHEPRQLFWIDDAFGSTQFEQHKAGSWNSIFPLISAAIKKGAKFILTSRTHIYRSAFRELKGSSFPLITDSQVVIRVENLSLLEKQRIVYNHIRLGNQPKSFRSAIKQFLPSISNSPNFFPELAKRLGDPFFTQNLSLDYFSIRNFIEEPKQFLFDIIEQLNSQHFAALALIFMRSGRLESPPNIDSSESKSIDLLGATLSGIVSSLSTLEGSLVQLAIEDSERFWKFRHPTVRDAMAMHVASQSHLLDVYLTGSKSTEIFAEVVCGNINIEGAKVHVPKSRYQLVNDKIRHFIIDDYYNSFRLLSFLSLRCSDDFLLQWLPKFHKKLFELFTKIPLTDARCCAFLIRLKSLGLLSENIRLEFVSNSTDQAAHNADSSFLNENNLRLIDDEEFNLMIERIRDELPDHLERIIDEVSDNYDDPDNDPSDHFDDLRLDITKLIDHFESIEDEKMPDLLYESESMIELAIRRIKERNDERAEEEEKKKRDEEIEEEYHRRIVEGKRQAAENAIFVRSTPVNPFQQLTQRPFSSSQPRSIFDDVDA